MPTRTNAAEDELRALPDTFTYAVARREGISDRSLNHLLEVGLIDRIGRGLYHRRDGHEADLDLLEIARRARSATLCLATALARHGLTDEIPGTIDVALPRGRHRAATLASVTWHAFDPETFDIGRNELSIDAQTSIGIYGPERSIIDAIRMRHREGPELAYSALKRWLTTRGSSPSQLLAMAHNFPQAEKALRTALEILL